MEFDWKTLVKTVAPAIASVFGTPLAGMGVTAILNAVLPDGTPRPDNPDEYLAKSLSMANPELLLKIKEADQKFKLDMKALDIDLEKYLENLENQDKASARDLKKSWLLSTKWDYEPVLAAIVAGSLLYAEYWVFTYAMSNAVMDTNKAILIGRVLGTVDAAFMLLISFRWGTSKGSERKTEIAAAEAASKVQ